MAITKNVKRNQKVKNPDGAPSSVIVQTIDVRPINRTNQDIPKWRQAIQSFEAHTPRRKLLYELYHDAVLDGHIVAVTGKRFDAVTGADWQFVNKKGEAMPIINDIIDSIGFEDLVKEILNSKFWGYSIFEPKFYKAHNENWEMEANLLPRRHYVPDKGIISFDAIGDDGINIREGIYAKTVIEVGDAKDLGLLAAAAQYYVLKRGGIGDYAMYVQVFGRPIIDATWDGVDEEQRQKLKAALNIGAGGTIIRPDGTTIEIKESKGTQSTVHEDFKNAMNAEISKALLGTTETTESSKSSGFAQSETHSDADDNKFTGDVTYVRKYLNSRFIKVLEAHGFDTEGGKFVVEKKNNETKKDKVAILVTAKEKFNLPMNDDDIYEATGIPKPDDYEAQKKAQKEALATPEAVEETPGKKPAKKADEKTNKPNTTKAKDNDEAEVKLYSKFQNWVKNDSFLKDFFLNAPAQVGATIGNHHTINLAFHKDIDNDALIKRVYNQKGNVQFDGTLFNFTLKTLLNAFKKGWDEQFVKLDAGLGFAYNYNDPAMLTAFELNLFRFAGAKDLALVQQLNALFRQSKSFKDFYNKASVITKIYNANHLETEQNTAYHIGNSAANYNRLLSQTEVYPYWQYVTADDDHVRNSHKPLHGIILHYTDPRWKQIFPPNGWNCRCSVRAVFAHNVDTSKIAADQAKADAYLASPAFAKEKASGFGVNRAEIGAIFTENQQYINTLNNNSQVILSNLDPAVWGLPKYADAKNRATNNAPAYTDEIKKAVSVLTDYNKRIIAFKANHFTDASKKGIAFAAIEKALKNPHEVWVQTNDANSFVYLHYYKDKTIAVRAILKDLELTIQEWADLETNKELVALFRKGMLAKL